MGYFYIAVTVFLSVYANLILKWQVSLLGEMPTELADKVLFVGKFLINPWIIGNFAAGFVAFLSWMAALSKFELSYAYPFLSLSFAVVLAASAVFLNETLTASKVVGIVLICVGLAIGSR